MTLSTLSVCHVAVCVFSVCGCLPLVEHSCTCCIMLDRSDLAVASVALLKSLVKLALQIRLNVVTRVSVSMKSIQLGGPQRQLWKTDTVELR